MMKPIRRVGINMHNHFYWSAKKIELQFIVYIVYIYGCLWLFSIYSR